MTGVRDTATGGETRTLASADEVSADIAAGFYQEPRPCVCGQSHLERSVYWRHRLEAEK